VPHSPETGVFASPERIRALRERRGRRPFRYIGRDPDVATRILALERALSESWPRWRNALAKRVSRPEWRWRLRGHHHRVRVFFEIARGARSQARILEKTPHHAAHLPEIFATFPRARVIVCLRHPLEVLSSLHKRLEAERARRRRQAPLRWLEVGPEELAERWLAVAAAAMRGEQRWPGRVQTLRYESLTADPEASLRALCAFLREEYDPALMEAGDERDAHGSPQVGGRLAHSRKRWHDFVSLEDARRLEAAVGPALGRWSYERLT